MWLADMMGLTHGPECVVACDNVDAATVAGVDRIGSGRECGKGIYRLPF